MKSLILKPSHVVAAALAALTCAGSVAQAETSAANAPNGAVLPVCIDGMQTGPLALHLSYPAKTTLAQPAHVVFTLKDGHLIADFEIHNKQLNVKPNLGPGEYPYQHDVVEIFVSVSGNAAGHFPYYEFELSPLDQTFNVQINDLKKPFINNIDKGVIHHAQQIPGGWRGELDIPLANLGWDGDVSKIAGNAYSIFGVAPNRSYWSLSIPNQPKPNFHQPNFFRPFFNCQMER